MRSRDRGFTLIELLLATLILALMVTTIFDVAHGVRRTAAVSRAQLRAAAQARQALDFAARDLASATLLGPPAVFDAPPRRGLHAGDKVLSLMTARPVHATDPRPGSDLALVQYSIRANPASTVSFELYREVAAFPAGGGPRMPNATGPRDVPATSRIASEVTSLALRFDDGHSWTTDWRGRPGLPARVEWKIRTAAGVGSRPFLASTTVFLPGAGGLP